MKLFIKKLLTFLSIQIILIILFCIILLQSIPLFEESYTSSLIDKLDRLESINDPKIVLIGNSNLSFGINSKLIEDELHMPTVNMGLQGSLGNAFHEEMAKINIGAGDIIIISHTSYYDNDKIEDTTLALCTLENHKILWNLVRDGDKKDLIKAIPSYALLVVKNLIIKSTYTEPYSRNSFNEFGDVYTLRTETKYNPKDSSKPPRINNTCVDRINELNRLVLENNAYLLVAAYPINIADSPILYDEFIQFQSELKDALDCPVISNYTDYFFDSSLFYDTLYHLTTEGADLRTHLLIEDIKKWQDTQTY